MRTCCLAASEAILRALCDQVAQTVSVLPKFELAALLATGSDLL